MNKPKYPRFIPTTDLIRKWAIARNLHTGDTARQMLKLTEEVGELASAIARNNEAGIIDAIGDIYVVITILALQNNLNVESCIDSAYEEIKNRTGKLVNGVFIKDNV